MKKMLVSLLSILLCMTMVLSFAACGEEEKKEETKNEAVATTAATTPTTKAPVAEPEEDEPVIDEPVIDEPEEVSIIGTWKGSADIADVLTQTYAAMGMDLVVDNFDMVYIYTFNDDGTVDLATDVDAMVEDVIGLMESLADSMGVSYEELLASEGMSEDDMIAMMAETVAASFTTALGDMTYEFDGSNLTFTTTTTGSNTVPVTLTATTLTFESNGVVLALTKQ